MELRQEGISARRMGPEAIKWIRWAVNALAGAVFAVARFSGGLRPFGVVYATAGGQALPAAMGAFLAYLLFGGRTGLVYAAATAVILTCRMVLDGTALAEKRWFYPACAATALFCTRFVILEDLQSFLLLLCETALCAACSMLLREGRDKRSPLAVWGRAAAGLCLLLAALPLHVGIFSPARMIAALVTLAAGCFGGGAAGACVGAIYGAGIDLSAGTGPFFALIWCVAGLSAGPGGRKDRLMAAMSFCTAGGVICLWLSQESGAMAALAELFLAGGGFLLLPRRLRVALETAFAGAVGSGRRVRPGASQALLRLSEAVGQLGQVMDGRWEGVSRDPGDLSTVYRSACETACRSCRRRDVCWQQEQSALKTMLADLADTLRSRHALEPENLPAWFRGTCLHSERFCGAVNDAYREALRREARLRREDTVRGVMSAQYESLEALLDSVAGRAGMGADYDPALEERVRRVVRAYLPRAGTAVCLTGGRLQIDLLLSDGGAALSGDVGTMLRSLQGALGVELLPPETVSSRKGACWRICQREKWNLEVRAAVRKKEGEAVCGDSFRQLRTDDGRAILLLSDGMGTGKQAGEISARALELVSSFVRSGCSLAESTSAVLPVLAARFTEWGFVTLDLLEVNLFTGQAALLKYGAAPGFLLREGRLTQFSAEALPAGLEPPGRQIPAAHLRLREGDRIVLMSDGVWENPDTESLLRDGGGLEGQALANALIREAARKGVCDDMTVLTATFTAAQTP